MSFAHALAFELMQRNAVVASSPTVASKLGPPSTNKYSVAERSPIEALKNRKMKKKSAVICAAGPCLTLASVQEEYLIERIILPVL